ncbi:LOW QUALITY PROTEIN: glutathione hydrolase-like YwrD proenzyme [Paramormyrops kingsleyae]|uniref:LOW QUALITY PROTEIN: glutathione hydrolase-like YwrD proenzyme n=1 Tax=Paramormyrops kingsleyae TaxID=1676925 RepID=UPI003B972FCC
MRAVISTVHNKSCAAECMVAFAEGIMLHFMSRRSPVVCLNGCDASSQPLASQIGLDTLKQGGNAADAAVAVAAALSVTEPCSTGLGGDCFCLYYEARTGQVRRLNGSGRSPRALTLEVLQGMGFDEASPPPLFHALNVTVPGSAACWCDTVELFGSKKLSLGEILQPATELALSGFPIAEVTAHHWANWAKVSGTDLSPDFLIDGRPPRHGEVFRNPALAQTFKELALHGKLGFYEGRIAEAIVDVVNRNGGVMSFLDLKSHAGTEVVPIFTDYKGVRLWEIPPNGQGIAALIILNILQNFSIREMGHNTAAYLHVLTEAIKLSVSDAARFCADPDKVSVPVEGLLSKDYARQRAQMINMTKASCVSTHGTPPGGDTVYFSVVDQHGNACSFVNSNYMGFGTGLVPQGCGFSLQNRGANFSLDSSHGNCVSPGKRPYHTIIPALLTEPVSGRLLCSFGVMGGFMQPQGHVQVLLNMLDFGMNPQEALDAPRIFVKFDKSAQGWQLLVEAGIDEEVAADLQALGHRIFWPVLGHERVQFGRGQAIAVGTWWEPASGPLNTASRVLWAGSDPRADGCAVGY